MRLINIIKHTVRGSSLAAALATSSLYCGPPDDPHPDGTVCCTTDAHTATDAGTPDTDSTTDAGNPDTGHPDAHSNDDAGTPDGTPPDATTPCTTTPTIHYTVTGATFDSNANAYKTPVNTPITIDACATTDADNYHIASSDPNTPTSTTCNTTYQYVTPGTYRHTITARNTPCDTTTTTTLDVLVEAAQNQPPVARAGPGTTLRVNRGYCFNFSDVTQNCGSTEFPQGYSVEGTGSYDPDGQINKFRIYQAVDDPVNGNIFTTTRGVSQKMGTKSMEYATTGTFMLRIEAEDDKGAKSTNDAIITVIE